MANKLLLADGVYEILTVSTVLVGVVGKQYWYRNGSVGNINVTYGGTVKVMVPDEVIGLIYDGTVWTLLTGAINSETVDDLTINGLTTVSSEGITSPSASVDILKPLTVQSATIGSTAGVPLNIQRLAGATPVGISFRMTNSASALYDYAQIYGGVVATTAGAETGFFDIYASIAGTLTKVAGFKDTISLLKPTAINNATIGTHQLAVNGTCANTTGVWAVLSDESVKTNIRDILNPLQKALDLADCVKQYEYIPEAEMIEGLRTQYIAQKLIEKGFEGHVQATLPKNEAVGEILGWEYADEEYIEKETVKETIIDEEGNEQEIDVEKDVTKTRRITVKEGDKLLQVENNFAPYAFPAIKVLKEENDILRQMVLDLTARVTALEEK